MTCLAYIEILARSKQKMLEGIILSVPPPYILVLCQSLLECAACPRMVLFLSSWPGGGARGGSSHCSRSDCSRPRHNYLSAVNNLWQALLLLFLFLSATLSVGSFSFHLSGRPRPRSLYSAPRPTSASTSCKL